MTEEEYIKQYGMTKEEYIEKYFNKVNTLTAICRSTSTWAHGEYQELEIGKTYHVSYIGVLRSSSNIMLDDYGDKVYKVGCFDLCENGEPIGRKYTKDPRYLAPYLREMMRADRYPYFEKEIEEKAIPAHLRSIEKEYDVRILLAVDFGSRAWGVESKNSDWDLRIVYVHKPEWYKKDGQHDVIEHVYENCIDVLGWDVKKALTLLKHGNLSLLEWLNSPKVYYIDEDFGKRIHSIEKDLFNPANAIRYYNQFYEKNNESVLQNDLCDTKLFIYILRGILSCKWIEKKGCLPPISLNNLIDVTIDDVDTRNKVNTIIRKKKDGKDDGVLILMGFIRQLADQYKVCVELSEPLGNTYSEDVLDSLLLDIIRGNANSDDRDKNDSSTKKVNTEILSLFQGKNNVRHISSDNGSVCWLTQERSFGDVVYEVGACGLNTVENEKKHVLFLFNDEDKEVGRYYIGKRLQGKTPEQLVEIKHRLVFFESWNPESKSWVPCVGLSANEPNSPVQSNSDSSEHTTLSTNTEKKRYIRIEDIDRGKLTDDELINLFVILHSYNPIEYSERNIWKINHYTKFPSAYSECLDHNCYPEDFEHAWHNFKYTDIRSIEAKLFFWGAVYCGEWKYYVSNEEPEYNRDNLKRLFLATQKRRIKHHKVIDGETAFMDAIKNGEDF